MAMPMPDAPALAHIGVDDWAMRKGSSCGTIWVDPSQRYVVDPPLDHTRATPAGWLGHRPYIRAAARNCSTENARRASLGAPRALQVADRWHLLANMRQSVWRGLHGARVRLRRDQGGPYGSQHLGGFEHWIREAGGCTASAIATLDPGLDGDGVAATQKAR